MIWFRYYLLLIIIGNISEGRKEEPLGSRVEGINYPGDYHKGCERKNVA